MQLSKQHNSTCVPQTIVCLLQPDAKAKTRQNILQDRVRGREHSVPSRLQNIVSKLPLDIARWIKLGHNNPFTTG